jgi:hypothetical protein
MPKRRRAGADDAAPPGPPLIDGLLVGASSHGGLGIFASFPLSVKRDTLLAIYGDVEVARMSAVIRWWSWKARYMVEVPEALAAAAGLAPLPSGDKWVLVMTGTYFSYFGSITSSGRARLIGESAGRWAALFNSVLPGSVAHARLCPVYSGGVWGVEVRACRSFQVRRGAPLEILINYGIVAARALARDLRAAAVRAAARMIADGRRLVGPRQCGVCGAFNSLSKSLAHSNGHKRPKM